MLPRAAEALVAVLVDALPGGADPAAGSGSLAARLWPALTDRPAAPADVELLDATLVLLADHDLAVSTVAARVAASARAHPYAVVSAGLGAIDGHTTARASTLAHGFLAAALPDPVARAVRAAALRRRRCPDSGTASTSGGTRGPRCCSSCCGGATRTHRCSPPSTSWSRTPRTRSRTSTSRWPPLAHAAGLRPDAGEAVFALARTVGWLAHALEEYRESPLRFRPVGVYTGERPDG